MTVQENNRRGGVLEAKLVSLTKSIVFSVSGCLRGLYHFQYRQLPKKQKETLCLINSRQLIKKIY